VSRRSYTPAVTRQEQRRRATLVALAGFSIVGIVIGLILDARPSGVGTSSGTTTTTEKGTGVSTGGKPPKTTTTTLPAFDGWVSPLSSGKPFYESKVDGLITFRGNPTRSYYGKGPVPKNPKVLVRFPEKAMCAHSPVGGVDKVWCGSGWTGQPSVFEREGRRWAVFGAYDKNIHFVDAITGERILPDFATGDIIKGSVSIDPEGYPLVYSGSRDNYVHVIAIDRPVPTELYRLSANAVSPTLWNDDWDGSPMVLGDYLFEGGENSQFHILKLNRGYDKDGKVTVSPKLIFNAPGWDQELLNAIGDKDVSIENSVAVSGNTVYFSNSGGLLQGWDIKGLKEGKTPTRTFRFWSGDDTDASVVVDEQGMLYVGSEYERGTAQSKKVGQLQKIDPTKPANPLVWSVPDLGSRPGGIWATPALDRDVVYVATNGGRLLGVDRMTGAIRWEKKLPGPTWQSPVVVDNVLIEGDCSGFLHGYDVSDTKVEPPEIWTVELSGCIESTPAVFKGRIYVGTRGGFWYIIGDEPTATTTTAAGKTTTTKK
jgi:hypothetical protein